MPTIAITETETNPTYVAGGGGGRRALTETEVEPTYFGEGGGGWHAFTVTELSPVLSLPAPEVTTDPATWIWPLLAILNASLVSGGAIEPCDCGFEWGETVAYGNTTPTQSKETGDSFSQVITGLLPNTTYHFRAFAIGLGTSYGADRTFVTDPVPILATVTTDPATGVGMVSANPNGTLDDNGGDLCECGFEWGETVAYGNTTPTQTKVTGEIFSQALSGLTPGTTYHFRAFATNMAGTSYGVDRTFTTYSISGGGGSRGYALGRHQL